MFDSVRELIVQFGKLFKWWTIISPWQQAVRVRLGKHTRVLGPGVHLLVPYIDTLYLQSNRKRVILSEMQTLTTADGKTITLSGQMIYAITDIEQLYRSVHHAEDTLGAIAQGAITDFVVSHRIEDITSASIARHVLDSSDFEQYGIGEVSFNVTAFAVVRTMRLIMDTQKEWLNGSGLDTDNANRG
jgi:regulator of protease activity HflC (stomatin/prohibitin superfamily)